MKKMFNTSMSKDQCKDTGMAMVLILLVTGLYTSNVLYIKFAIAALLVDMIVPNVFYPLAILWFGLSVMMGAVMSRVLLSIVYFLLVFPIGVLRKLLGYDSLKLKEWKKSSASVMKSKMHLYQSSDLENPY